MVFRLHFRKDIHVLGNIYAVHILDLLLSSWDPEMNKVVFPWKEFRV